MWGIEQSAELSCDFVTKRLWIISIYIRWNSTTVSCGTSQQFPGIDCRYFIVQGDIRIKKYYVQGRDQDEMWWVDKSISCNKSNSGHVNSLSSVYYKVKPPPRAALAKWKHLFRRGFVCGDVQLFMSFTSFFLVRHYDEELTSRLPLSCFSRTSVCRWSSKCHNVTINAPKFYSQVQLLLLLLSSSKFFFLSYFGCYT